jgi:peptidoglycan hydrolase CwlO-like protein
MFERIKRRKRIKLAKGRPNVKVGVLWINKVFYTFIVFILSVILSYFIFDGSGSVQYLLKINDQNDEIVNLKDELNKLNLQIQLDNVTISKNNEELKKLKEENNDLQEELLFYEKIVGKRR